MIVEISMYFLVGEDFTVPQDAPDLPQFRVINMYHSCTDTIVKDSTAKRFVETSHL